MELLIFYVSVLQNSKIIFLVILLMMIVHKALLFLRSKLLRFELYIFILDFNNILFIFVNDAQHLSLYLDEVVADLSFAQVEHAFLHD